MTAVGPVSWDAYSLVLWCSQGRGQGVSLRDNTELTRRADRACREGEVGGRSRGGGGLC